MLRQFPDDFLWGAATSSYQIEGAWDADGKGENVWDRFSHKPYRVMNGDTGDVACDHYHWMPEDVAIMRELGLQSYRFSVSWARVLPEGRGAVNEKGLDFYDRLVDELLAADIKPNATLNHWDFPQAMQDAGGWPHRDSADWFAEYAQVMFERLGDRVDYWATHNEPWVVAFVGYAMGRMAPGLNDYSKAFQSVHHLLLAHGRAVQIYRQGGYPGKIGIVLNMGHIQPASDSEADRDAARRVYESFVPLFLGPIYEGRYPERLFDWIGPQAPDVQEGDMELIHRPIDWVGINYYHTQSVRHNVHAGGVNAEVHTVSEPAWGRTVMDWGIAPGGLKHVLLDVDEKYGSPALFVTENGTALEDTPDETGYVYDTGRANFIRGHLLAVHDAIQAGADVRGYYVWSFLDNFEWAWGYGPRFGIVRVNFDTLARTPKHSALWYRDVIAQNAVAE